MRGKFLFTLYSFSILFLFSGCSVPVPIVVHPQTFPTALPTTLVLPNQATAASALSTSTIVPTKDGHVSGANCKTCHPDEYQRWVNTHHAADVAAVLTNEGHNRVEMLADECLFCHAPFQAGEYNIGSFVQPVDLKGPFNVVEENRDKWEAIKCETCHNPTSKSPQKLAFFDPAEGDYVQVKDSTELCEKCHRPGTDDSRDLNGSVHEGMQCITCHFQKDTEMSLDTKRSCAQCHPQVNPKHPDVTQLDTTFFSAKSQNNIHFVPCKTCHPVHYPNPKP